MSKEEDTPLKKAEYLGIVGATKPNIKVMETSDSLVLEFDRFILTVQEKK